VKGLLYLVGLVVLVGLAIPFGGLLLLPATCNAMNVDSEVDTLAMVVVSVNATADCCMPEARCGRARWGIPSASVAVTKRIASIARPKGRLIKIVGRTAKGIRPQGRLRDRTRNVVLKLPVIRRRHN